MIQWIIDFFSLFQMKSGELETVRSVDSTELNEESQDGQVPLQLSKKHESNLISREPEDDQDPSEPKSMGEDGQVHSDLESKEVLSGANNKLEYGQGSLVLSNKLEDGHFPLQLMDKAEDENVQLESLNESRRLEQERHNHRGVGLVSLESGEQFECLYNVYQQVGDGTFSIVYMISNCLSKETKAAKVMKYRNKLEYEEILKEVKILNCFKHPNLPQLSAAYEMPNKIITVMEYMSGGELTDRVTSSEHDSIVYLRQMCDALSYMHCRQIVHLDLKPENVMFLSPTSKTVKIIDFGLAKILSSDVGLRPEWGASEFMPPEWNKDFDTPLGPEADVWGAGVLCYLLLSGATPFTGKTHKETRVKIINITYSFDKKCFNSISDEGKDFISSILVLKKERPTAIECLQHKWLL